MKEACIKEGCIKPQRTRKMCMNHYMQWYRVRDVGDTCTHCKSPVNAKGLCSAHYQRLRSHGDPRVLKVQRGDPYDTVAAIGVEADPEGDCLLWKGGTLEGYAHVVRKGSRLRAHRVVYQKWHGPIPPDRVVDHECHNRAAHLGLCSGGPTCKHRRCLNPAHLRAITWKQNMQASPLTRHKEQA